MNVVGLKLITGEEIICEVSYKNDESFFVKNPVTVMPIHNTDIQKNTMMFIPYPTICDFETDGNVEILRNHVICVFEPEKILKENYDKIYGSGIVVPKKEILLG